MVIIETLDKLENSNFVESTSFPKSTRRVAIIDNELYAIQLDDYTTASVTYIGYAVIGSSTSSAVWRIKKIDETTGVIITWANGNANFDNIWDDRVSLSYN